MKDAVAKCNTALKHPDGSRLPLGELNAFFEKAENQTLHSLAYKEFKTACDENYSPHQILFYEYCEKEEVFKKYISDYYGQKQWIAFQLNVEGEQTKSIVDIAAKLTQSCIEIYQLENEIYKNIYKTDKYGENIKIIEYNKNNHFIELEPDVNVENIPAVAKEATQKLRTSTTVLSSPPGKELLLSRGFAGSIYQVKVLMLLAFNAYCEKKPFHLYTEAEGFGKFDDCVLFLESEMQVMQVKHSFDPKGCYLLEHLVGDGAGTGKKATLSKYFDSWLTIETLRQKNPDRYPKEIEYLFYTNHALSTEDGLSAIYDDRTGKFSTKLLDGTLNDSKLENARKSILRSIYLYIQNIQNQIHITCNSVIEHFLKPKEPKGKAKNAVVINSTDCSNGAKILFALLLKYKCIAKTNRESFYNKDCYELTNEFISDEKCKQQPAVIQLLRKSLISQESFQIIKQLQEFRFYIAENQFSSLELNKNPTIIDIILKVGNLSILGDNFLFRFANCFIKWERYKRLIDALLSLSRLCFFSNDFHKVLNSCVLSSIF